MVLVLIYRKLNFYSDAHSPGCLPFWVLISSLGTERLAEGRANYPSP
jgi:hypothetical protein